MSTTVVKERAGSNILILHSTTTPHPHHKSARRYNAYRPSIPNLHDAAAEDNRPPPAEQNLLAVYLDQLSDPKKYKAALPLMLDILTRMRPPSEMEMEVGEFVVANRVTLAENCLRVIGKRRPTEELAAAAARVIGLAAMILNNDHTAAHEVVKYSVPELFEAVKKFRGSGELATVQMLECLAVVTFFGADRTHEDRVKPMDMLWDYFFDHQGEKKKEKHHPPEVVAAAISSWCFILTKSIYGFGPSYRQSKLPCLLQLLDHDHHSVAIAAAEALAINFAIDSHHKTQHDDTAPSNQLKDIIAEKLKKRKLAMQATDNSNNNNNNKDITTRLTLVAKCFEGEQFKMQEKKWSERFQLAFLGRFLGKERFAKHLKANQQLQSMFKVKNHGKEEEKKKKMMTEAEEQPAGYEAEREEVKSRFYKPNLNWMINKDGSPCFEEFQKERQMYKKLTKSPNSWWSKVKTQHMKQQRQVAAHDKNIFLTQ